MADGAARRSPGRWFAEGGWYFAVVALSFGILSPVPFAHAATRLRTPLSVLWPVLYAVAVGSIMAIPTRDAAGNDLDPSNTVGGLIVGVTVVALAHLVWVRRLVWGAPRPAHPDPAVAAALAARARRTEARRIVAEDPVLARELRIGRPDLARDYDDGGLVDLNEAPAGAIAAACGIDPAVAARIVQARDVTGVPMAAVDDVFVHTDIPVALWDRIRDRGVVVP
jgi:DNA uptake protein ComE-like DNA-binding protein